MKEMNTSVGMTAQPHEFHRAKGIAARPIIRKREVWRV
jgi:hypothetical protein